MNCSLVTYELHNNYLELIMFSTLNKTLDSP